eukprot:2333364-Rhodomonas_salina.3
MGNRRNIGVPSSPAYTISKDEDTRESPRIFHATDRDWGKAPDVILQMRCALSGAERACCGAPRHFCHHADQAAGQPPTRAMCDVGCVMCDV